MTTTGTKTRRIQSGVGGSFLQTYVDTIVGFPYVSPKLISSFPLAIRPIGSKYDDVSVVIYRLKFYLQGEQSFHDAIIRVSKSPTTTKKTISNLIPA